MTNRTYTASEYVEYGQLVAEYSYLLVQQAAPYIDQLPPNIQSYVNPGVDGADPELFSELYANSTRTLEFTTQYGFSIALMPIGLCILGLLTICVLNSVICSRWCCKCSRCEVKAKKRTKGTTTAMATAAEAAIAKAELYGKQDERAMRLRDKAESERVHKSITKQRKRLTGLFAVFALLSLITGTGLAYISHTYFEEAYTSYDATIADFDSTFAGWAASTNALQVEIDSLHRALPNAKVECDATTALSELDGGIEGLEDSLPPLNEAIEGLQSMTMSAVASLGTYLGGTRQYVSYGFGALPLIFFLLCVSMVVSGTERKYCLNRSAMCCGQCIIFLYTLILVPMLFLTIAMSDLCISEAPMLLLEDQLIPAGALSSNATDMFLGCNNPFTEAMDTATHGMVEMHSHILGILDGPRVSGSTCPDFASGNFWVLDMNTTVSNIYEGPYGILPNFVGGDPACPTFKASLTGAVDENVCGSTYNAIFALTASILACSFTTLLCLCFLMPLKSHYIYLMKVWDEEEIGNAYADDDTDSEDELDPHELLDKPGEMDSTGINNGNGGAGAVVYEETKDEEDDDVSKVTEFDWTALDTEPIKTDGDGIDDPHYNPNSKDAKTQGRQGQGGSSTQMFAGPGRGGVRGTQDSLLDYDLESLGESVKSVEDTVHYEAINDAGYEDDL